ncbi:MAG: thiol reductase thioredoxin [Gammaproteobacteria bacterium RIFCSPLOWO2_02_FULL_42_14]|nr:MAG: thiol reductase thioredoxin [Gammaproteobacteria bacterium RIFCSPHIGHO2_02_FULL_42_43]OGT51193.1 MAG: thiol reductase thioredoxin [Gammaproteobacteria bacterium RIFCSPHIGHO2_12_FULL_41_25]OGT62955.1 MAG: thiol reductase thioredoxin [Gammaproteobacteria bacterium RIFCSPLOWO2_02_FULL_42_14]OGT86087.1 MAG: thiol reductase thioredoxin [Gammaproteobacteria bacterium RIFCSPLOWO2_12_FULL_42_18]
MTVHALTAATFDSTLESHSFLVIDFWATWCGPCKGFSTVLHKVAKEYPDIYFGSVDVEAEKALADEFDIRSVPFVIIMRDKVMVYAESGALSESALRELLDNAKKLTKEQLGSA